MAQANAHAGQGFPNVKQNLFVAARSSHAITVIDTDLERVVGALDLGLEPKQFVVDTVAIASVFQKAVIYDLDAMARVRDIPLDGAAGPGSVTPDGKKLFLPLEDAGKVAVIDAQSRRLTNTIPVGPRPVAAIMAGGYGVCH